MRCLRGDDDVITNKGLVKLKNIKNGDLVLTHDGSFQKVINKENNGIRKVDRITTNLNINYSTNNHRWLVLNNLSGEFREVYASDLKEGDVLLLNNRSVSGEYQDFPKYTDLKLPKLDEDLAWFIGYFLGNGNVSTRTRSDTGFEDNKFRVCIPTNYPTIVNKVKSIFEKIVGTYSIHKKKSAIELTSSKKCFVEYFLNIKQPNTPIQIPDFIKQNTSSIQLAFLAGVLDSDGSVRNDNKNGKGYGQITLNSSKYSIFITQLQALYNLNGIITKIQTKIRKEKSNEYILKTVSFKYRKECVEKLSLYSEKLKEDYILEEISKEKDGIYFPKYLAIRGEGNKIWNSCKRCSLNKVLEYYPDLNYIPAVITNIEKDVEEVEVFDIEVENNHNFYVNGVLTHNSALAILFSPNDEEMYNSKVGNWFYDNPQRGRYNASVALERSDDNKEVFNKIFESTKEYGEPGFFFRSDSGIGCNPCFEIGFKPILEIEKPDGVSKQTGIQFCVAGDTKLITKNGIKEIKNCIGKEIEIWNGKQWSKVIPFQTGTQDDLYRVYLSDGSFLDVTNNHRFLIKTHTLKEYKELTTLEIIEYINTHKSKLQVPRPKISDFSFGKRINNAYEYGFFTGDGHIAKNEDREYPEVYIYKNSKDKLKLNFKYFVRGYETDKYISYKFTDVDKSLCHKLKDRTQGIPEEIFSWDRKSILEFIAGWGDSDGSLQGKGIRIYGSELHMRDLQLLLTKVGIESSVNLMALKGSMTNLCERKSDIWYVQITKTINIPCRRLKCNNRSLGPKNKNVLIKKVELLKGKYPSYCLTEPLLHQCTFNNILTKQCNLISISGKESTTEEKFYKQCKAAATIGTIQATYNSFPFLGEVTEQLAKNDPLIGVSISGIMMNPDILLNENILRKGAEIIKEQNSKIANLLRINPASRTTCIKPKILGI